MFEQTIYAVTFERDSHNPLLSSGAFTPEQYIDQCSIGQCVERLADYKGERGKAYICKLELKNSEELLHDLFTPLFFATQYDRIPQHRKEGLAYRPILWERVGRDHEREIYTFGDFAFYHLVDSEEFDIKKDNYFTAKKETNSFIRCPRCEEKEFDQGTNLCQSCGFDSIMDLVDYWKK